MSIRGPRDRTFFKDKNVLAEMLAHRRAGWSLSRLGKKYGVNHATIFYWSKRNGVTPNEQLTLDEARREIYASLKIPLYSPISTPKSSISTTKITPNILLKRPKLELLPEEHINRGKLTYAAYLDEESMRGKKWAKKYPALLTKASETKIL